MTSHTETERGVLTDGYEGGEGEILVSEAMNPFTKEETKRREKGAAATTIQTMLQSIRAQERCCLCEGCVRRGQERGTKRSTEEIVDSVANKIKQMTWPEQVGKNKVVFVQQRPKRRKRDSASRRMMWAKLGKCHIRFASEEDREGEITVLPDARQFIFGFTPRDGDPTARTGSRRGNCRFRTKTEIKLVVGMEHVRGLHKHNDKGERLINCTTADRVPWIMQDTTWKPAVGMEPQTIQWSEMMEELTDEMQQLGGVQLEWQRQGIPKTVTMEEMLCPITADLTTSQKESSESFEALQVENHVGESDDSDYTDDETSMVKSHSDNFVMSAEDWRKHEEKYIDVDKFRLLMWNPENLAQRLDLDGTVSRGKTI